MHRPPQATWQIGQVIERLLTVVISDDKAGVQFLNGSEAAGGHVLPEGAANGAGVIGGRFIDHGPGAPHPVFGAPAVSMSV
jgi:hypothetical protein